jgi:hypothetical protein
VDGEAAGDGEAGVGEAGNGEGISDSDGRLCLIFWLIFLLIFRFMEAAISASRFIFLDIEASISVSEGFLRLKFLDNEFGVVLRLILLEKDLGVGVLHLLLLAFLERLRRESKLSSMLC